jgi:hypothetical protein
MLKCGNKKPFPFKIKSVVNAVGDSLRKNHVVLVPATKLIDNFVVRLRVNVAIDSGDTIHVARHLDAAQAA